MSNAKNTDNVQNNRKKSEKLAFFKKQSDLHQNEKLLNKQGLLPFKDKMKGFLNF